MSLHENTDFGRKVFFLNMPHDFQRDVVTDLFNKEYEVYTINDFHRAKQVLRNFPDSICFIYVDDGMTLNEWFNYMSSFEEDSLLSTIFLGIVSNKLGDAQKIHFLMQSVVPAGFIALNQPYGELFNQVRSILDLNGAKGRRRFIRADCQDDPRVSVFFNFDDVRFAMKIKDISSAGLSCVASAKYADSFKVNMLIREFTLTLQSRSYKCSAAVLMAAVKDNVLTLVLVFTPKIGTSTRLAIKEYIRSHLQSKITKSIIETVPEYTDYTEAGKQKYVITENTANEAAVPEAVLEEVSDSEEDKQDAAEAESKDDAENQDEESKTAEETVSNENEADNGAEPESLDISPESETV